MAKIAGLDSDGKLIVKIDPKQVVVGADGKISIDSKQLKDFLDDKKKNIAQDLHLIMMGSACGCQCCC
jgi:hypothetical protein